MKKITIITCMAFAIAGISMVQSCKKDNKGTDETQEFIADDNSFKDFKNWTLEATNQGPDPALGTAHAGNDSSVTRKIYVKDGQDPVSGKYPEGTIIVKHSSSPDGSVEEYTAMVKRGNNFNQEAGDWEWFMLAPDGTIGTDANGDKMRGANLMNGMCSSCHAKASSKDFVFSK